jgi:hypothetical protein
MRICGVNEELLGAENDNKVGITEALRQGAGLINLQEPFDVFRQAKEMIGLKTIELIQNNWTPEKVFRVTKMQPTEEFFNKDFGKYDCACVEAQLTETQQQLFFRELLTFKQMEAPISWSAIMKAYPGQGKKEILDDMAQQEQQQAAMQQAQMQSQIEDKQIVNTLLMKEAQLKVASAKEKLAKAQEETALTAYHEAKAAKELDSMGLDNLHKFIDGIMKLENRSQINQNLEEQEVLTSGRQS